MVNMIDVVSILQYVIQNYMLTYLTKVSIRGTVLAWGDQDFLKHCRSFGGNFLLTGPVWSTWRKAGGRRDSSAQNVAEGSIGSSESLLAMSAGGAAGVLPLCLVR